MQPCLPQHSSHPDKRLSQLVQARKEHEYSYTWPPEVAAPKALHVSQFFSPGYMVKVAELDITLTANHAAMGIVTIDHALEHEKSHTLWSDISHGRFVEHFFHAATKLIDRMPSAAPEELQHYERYFAHIPAPPLVAYANTHGGLDDAAFAWQRVAGANPMMLQGIAQLPDKFPVSEAIFQQSMGEEDSLAAAGAEGRLFIADYPLLDGASGGDNRGRQKYISAPIALFATTRQGKLLPVAIQLHQQPGPDAPIFTPADGWHWAMAKLFVQIADANMHEAIEHLGLTHMVVQAVAMSAARQLAPEHPLMVLLGPHFEFTTAINYTAAHNLVAPGGLVDQIMAPPIASVLGALKAGMDAFVLQDAAPPKALAARGVDNRQTLPQYPYRDDALTLWPVIERFVRDYIGLYYGGDADVVADTELRAWLAELGAEDGGRLKHIRAVESIDALVELVAIVIFTATCQHAAVNFAQFPFMGWVQNMPGAAWAPPPTRDTPNTREAYQALLPPWDMTVAAADAVYQLSNLRMNWLGQYPPLHFRDHRVAAVLQRFKDGLHAAEAVIVEANRERLLPYPFLVPSTIPNSIHI